MEPSQALKNATVEDLLTLIEAVQRGENVVDDCEEEMLIFGDDETAAVEVDTIDPQTGEVIETGTAREVSGVPAVAEGLPVRDEDVDGLARVMRAYEARRRMNRSSNFKPAQEHEINQNFGDYRAGGTTPKTSAFKQAYVNENVDKKSDWASQAYMGNGQVNVCGKQIDYGLKIERVDWGEKLSKDPSLTGENLDYIRNRFTKSVIQAFGGLDRFVDVVVTGEQLIINGNCYVPRLSDDYLKYLPLDCASYFQNGTLARFFNWSCLKRMSRLNSLMIDDASFFVTEVADDLGLSRRIGVSSMFRICPSLSYLNVGGEEVTRESLNTPESAGIKEKVRNEKRKFDLLDGYKLNVYGGTNGLQNFMFGSLKNYATNRGNKGIIRYCCGTVARAIGAGVAGILNLGAHLIGGSFKTIKQTLSDGMTPVSADELKG